MPRPGILIAHYDGVDAFDDDALNRLDAVGRLLDRRAVTDWDLDWVQPLLAEVEIVVGHWGAPLFSPEVLARLPNLKLFAYGAGTVKWYLTDELWDRGVVVTSGANANAEPVAEYTLAMILLANKGAFAAIDRERRRDTWVPPEGARRVGNWDKTIGLVSASLIGRRVSELLTAFPQLHTAIFDPFVDADAIEAAGATKVDDLVELAARSDILSIHAPALPSTHNLVDADVLAALPDGATVINTARGHCLDMDALVAELETGRLFAIIDVTDPVEPVPEDHALRTLPNAVLTPHLAGSQGSELWRMADWVIDEVERFVAGRPQRNQITREMIDRIA